MNAYLLFKSIHLIAVISWMAGLLYLPRIFVYHSTAVENKKSEDLMSTFKVMERRLFIYIMNPAMILTIFFGFLLLKTDGIINWSEKWIYFKLLGVFLILIVHHLLSKYRKDFSMDNNIHSKKFYKILNEIPTVLLIIIILLVYLKPF